MTTKALSTIYASIPSLDQADGLKQYLNEIKKFPILSPEEEKNLATSYAKTGDLKAAHALVTSHLRLVAKIAFGYKRYGLPMADLISEGNLGLMRAVKKFEVDKGFKLATYAMWWIKASIHEHILNSWSLVKMGTVAAQKKLFFNLRKMKNKLGIMSDNDMTPEEVQYIAHELDVPENEVIDMNRRMSGDTSLNTMVGDDESAAERIDLLQDNAPNQEVVYADHEEKKNRHNILMKGLEALNEREQYIIMQRRLRDNPQTLEDLADHFNISRERVRQIENRAFEKLQQAILN